MLWSYYNSVALHQVIFDNHCHTQICSGQRPQHTDTRRKQLDHVKKLDVILNTDKCCIPCVFLDADLFWDRQGEDDDKAHDEEGKSLVGVPVIRHLSLTGASHHLV